MKIASFLSSYLTKLVDVVCILAAAYLALHIRRLFDFPEVMPVNFIAGYVGLAMIAALLFLLLPGNETNPLRGKKMPEMLVKLSVRWALVVNLILLFLFVFKGMQEFSRVWFVLWIVSSIVLMWAGRIIIYLTLRSMSSRGIAVRHVALVGADDALASLQKQMASIDYSGYVVSQVMHPQDLARLAALADLPLDEIWLLLPLGAQHEIENVLHALRHSAASIRLVPDLLTLRLINKGVTEIMGVPMYDLSASLMEGRNQLVKWVEDKILSLLILLVLSPVMLAVAVGVKFSSRGPVFYRQERVGLNNRSFGMLKFRSMPVDIEKEDVRWGGATDKVNTRFGRFIRRTSLDELPQFFNVLLGDMSIVGPRPERPMFVEQFKDQIPLYMKKHLVKAGITGWAQVNGWRGDTDLRKRIEFDIFYIENWSIWLDLKIILLTLFRVILSKDVR